MDDDNKKQCSFALIDSLCNELNEVKLLAHPLKRVLPWIILALIYLAVSIYFFGLRHDFGAQWHNQHYVFELLLVSAISFSSALCSVWLCVPDMRGQKWMLAIPICLFCVFLCWISLKILMESFHIPNAPWHFCYIEALVFGVVPAFMIFLISSRGKTTHPLLLSFMNTLAFGGLGYIGLRLTCASEEAGHICFFHIAPYIFFGLLAAVLGNKIYRW